jgi:hypothetical protein
MDCDLPNLDWARLRVFPDRTADVFDCDGRHHSFRSANEARDWLAEDEFVPVSSLEQDDLSPYLLELDDVTPPRAVSDSDGELRSRMKMRVWGGALRQAIAATTFTAPWVHLSLEERHVLQRDLAGALSPGHALFGRTVRAVGRHAVGGDVLFLVDAPAELVIVRLVRSSTLPHPSTPTTHLLSFDDFLNRMLRDAAEANGS